MSFKRQYQRNRCIFNIWNTQKLKVKDNPTEVAMATSTEIFKITSLQMNKGGASNLKSQFGLLQPRIL